MAERRPYDWRYPFEVHRRKVPNVAMGKRPWLPPGETAPPTKRYTPEEIKAFIASCPELLK